MRLIDAVELAEELSERVWYKREDEKQAVRIVKEFPTVDAVPVVRCKDCRHRDPEDHKCDCGELERQGCPFPVDDDYFCAYGERKGGEQQ